MHGKKVRQYLIQCDKGGWPLLSHPRRDRGSDPVSHLFATQMSSFKFMFELIAELIVDHCKELGIFEVGASVIEEWLHIE